MSDTPNDRPLSSEEMIKQARAELDRRPATTESEMDTDQIRDRVEEEMPSIDELVAPPRPSQARQRTPRRVTRVERRPPAGFGDTQRPNSSNAIAIAVAMALLVMGAAVFLVLAASGTG